MSSMDEESSQAKQQKKKKYDEVPSVTKKTADEKKINKISMFNFRDSCSRCCHSNLIFV